jgi:hypothetical protein
MIFDQELETFRRELPRLLKEQEELAARPRWALVKGSEVRGVWDTEADAVRAGALLFGMEPFLVKEVTAIEKPLMCLHGRIVPCQA